MLDPITKPRRRRKFLTYDLEWSKGETERDSRGEYQRPVLRLVGVYDGRSRRNRYRAYFTVKDFLEGELTRANAGRWFYAHAGGLADIVFLLEHLQDDASYTVEASFSGSSAIIVNIKRGRLKWTFVDSYWLLRDKLANIARFVGMEKGEVDFDTEDTADLIRYNRLDCEILYNAVASFEGHLTSLGGELGMTLASSAMALFRRSYLKAPIDNRRSVNEKTRGAYYASRVEVIARECHDAYYYDVNSSFPYAMTYPVPGSLTRSGTMLDLEYLGDSARELVFAECTIHVPQMHFPPLPFRWGGSVYFPTGTWRAWFTGIDLELLLQCGGSILECHESLYFEPRTDLRDYALDLYQRRLEARKHNPDAMEVVVYKLLLNSLYGKFGEAREKTGLILNHDDPPHPEDEEALGLTLLFPGAYLVKREVEVVHEHVPIAAWITSIARRTLYRAMVEAGECFYCDTDGFATTNPNVTTGDGLGDLKLETVIKHGYFHRPKVYMMTDDSGDTKVRAKGFTLRPDNQETPGMGDDERKQYLKGKSVAHFLALLEGDPIEMRRFMRVRELFRDGSVIPTERTIRKQLRNTAREKRCPLPGGTTRPWTIDELTT